MDTEKIWDKTFRIDPDAFSWSCIWRECGALKRFRLLAILVYPTRCHMRPDGSA